MLLLLGLVPVVWRSKQRRISDGKRSIGYRERYEAKPNANMALKLLPVIPSRIAWMIAVFVNALVDRPKQVAIVKGLNKYLSQLVSGPRYLFDVY